MTTTSLSSLSDRDLLTETRRIAETERRTTAALLSLLAEVDWTEPHRDQVQAEIRAAVRRVLRRRGVREADFEPFIERFMGQARAMYADWPLVA